MTSLPAGIKTVRPTQIAEFMAVQWEGDVEDRAVAWLAERFNWTIIGLITPARGSTLPRLALRGRNAKRYTVCQGEWIIALGSNGSMRVVSDRQYRADYKEVK